MDGLHGSSVFLEDAMLELGRVIVVQHCMQPVLWDRIEEYLEVRGVFVVGRFIRQDAC